MKKVMIIAYDVNPNLGSEAGVASLWLKIITRYYQAFVITDEKHRNDLEEYNYGAARFFYISQKDVLSRFYKKNRLYFSAYAIFIRKAWPLLIDLVRNHDFKLLHCLTPAGVYIYNDLYKLGLPMMIGPLGGGLNTPKGFQSLFKSSLLKERVRSLFYDRVNRNEKRLNYFHNAKKILIGTDYVRAHLPVEVQGRTELLFDVMVDTAKFTPAVKRSSEEVHISYIARLDPQKGPTLLLEAMRKISRKRNDIHLTMAGTGDSFNALQDYITEHEMHNTVKLTGRLSREEVINLLQHSDIFCLPTLREPGGVAILEAMSCGLPIITTDYGGPSFSVTDDCGIKIKPTNFSQYVDDLVQAILHLADDRQLRLEMGAKSRQRAVDHFSPASFEEKVIALYSSISEIHNISNI